MEADDDVYSPSNLARESVTLPEDHKDTTMTYEQYKSTHTRKVSIPSIRDDDRAKYR